MSSDSSALKPRIVHVSSVVEYKSSKDVYEFRPNIPRDVDLLTEELVKETEDALEQLRVLINFARDCVDQPLWHKLVDLQFNLTRR
jgi:hypothetical protein